MFDLLADYLSSFFHDQFPAALAGTVVFLLLRFFLIRRTILPRHGLPHEIGLTVFVLYLAALLSLTFLPFYPAFGGFAFHSTLLAMARGEYTTGAWGLTMLAGNALMLFPFGLLAPLLWKHLRYWRVLPVGLAAVILIEVLQPFAGRSFDIDDIILNFIGLAVGALLSAAVQALLPRQVTALRT